ncbi:MAG: hypothetical protein U9R21_05930, partial [Candidatus Thermoplasmatota archaeon]|nr:hypothetical protein [Candidatus Thermoplasmatota archaeon]
IDALVAEHEKEIAPKELGSTTDNKIEENSDKIQQEAENGIDALVAEHEKEIAPKELDFTPKKELKDSPEKIGETREHFKKNPEIPRSETEVKTENTSDTFEPLNSKEELFETKKPSELTEKKPAKKKGFLKQIFGDRNKTTYDSAMKFPHIKIRNKDEMKRLKSEKIKSEKISSPQELTGITKKGTDDQQPFTKTNEENRKEATNAEPAERKTINSKWKEKIKFKKAEKLETDRNKDLKKRFEDVEKRRKLKSKRDIQERESNERKTWNSSSHHTPNNKTPRSEKKQDRKNKSPVHGMHRFIIGKREVERENPLLDDEIKKVLTITDNLLGKLPEEIIDEFAKSKDFELYEKIIGKYKIK